MKHFLLGFACISLLVLGQPLPADQVLRQSDGIELITLGEDRTVNEMAVYPPGGIANRPLLIAAHGHGGSGPKEIEGWLDLAKPHNFTIVCPTFVSAIHSVHVPQDVDYFKQCIQWVQSHLLFDKSNVYMTGFSGGGYAVWYLGTSRPDFIRGLFLQSGNFAGDNVYNFDPSGWVRKPIHLEWGTEDSPTVMAQNKEVLSLLQAKGFKNLTFEIIPGAHHQPHHDLVANWLEQQSRVTVSN